MRLCRLYQGVAAGRSRSLRLGESVGAVRAVHFGRIQKKAVALFCHANYARFIIISTAPVLPEAFRRREDEVRQIELFAEHIIPAFRWAL